MPIVTLAPSKPSALVEAYCATRREAAQLKQQHGGTMRPLKNRNWAALTPPPAPVKIRDSLVIIGDKSAVGLARARKEFPNRKIIVIPPELAFGTGHHATTATVLRLIADAAEQWRRQGRQWTMLDLGCGSGILGIAAHKLGAQTVWAGDFDPQAVRVTRENMRRNQVRSGMTAQLSDVLRWSPTARHDCVVANIFSEVLAAAFPKIARAVKPDGIVIVSGLLRSQASECLAAAARAGLEFDHIQSLGRWVSARGRLHPKG